MTFRVVTRSKGYAEYVKEFHYKKEAEKFFEERIKLVKYNGGEALLQEAIWTTKDFFVSD